MSEPRKHHYLPQFYLRGFSIDRRQLFQIEKKTGKSYPCRIKDAAAIKDFHRQDGGEDTPDRNAFEKSLAGLESTQARLLASVLETGFRHSIPPGGSDLSLVSVMRMRVPPVKRHIDQSRQAMVRSSAELMRRAGKLPAPPPGLEKTLDLQNLDIVISNWKCLEIMFQMAASERALEDLARMRLTLHRAPFGETFLTCDQPVSLIHETEKGAGPSTPGVEISFPLSSDTLLTLDHDTGSSCERIANTIEVQEFNRRTITMADRYIFFCSAF